MEFTKGQEVFVPSLGAVYVITEITPSGELYCSRGVHGWQHDRIRINPAEQQVIPLAQVLAAPTMLTVLKKVMDTPSEPSVFAQTVKGIAKAAIAQAEPDGK